MTLPKFHESCNFEAAGIGPVQHGSATPARVLLLLRSRDLLYSSNRYGAPPNFSLSVNGLNLPSELLATAANGQ